MCDGKPLGIKAGMAYGFLSWSHGSFYARVERGGEAKRGHPEAAL
jgi:hypothetical protein